MANNFAKALGRIGGKRRLETMTRDDRRAVAKKARAAQLIPTDANTDQPTQKVTGGRDVDEPTNVSTKTSEDRG
jgi:3-phosphoglycerate kinase